jgi:outer membrane biosynthesis protein TonB
MRGSRRSLLRQASVLIVLCCAFAIGASQALAQDPAPEPAPRNSSGPKPEAPPGATRQPEQPVTQTTPPPAPPPPPAATNPPPAAVTPPPAPVYQPATTQIRPETRDQRREPARPKPKPRVRDKPKIGPVKTAVAAPPGFSRDEATSPDTLLMVGGLALFFLVLADVVFLTLSTRVLRTR